MKVKLVGLTQFFPDADVPWEPNASGGEALIEFAGRACYQSWHRPNPATATNAGYIAHILEVGHFSVLEHASASFYVTGVSRSLTHELVRHRHLSYSQLSQRYVDESNADDDVVYPPALNDDERSLVDVVTTDALHWYRRLVDSLTERGLTRKQARQAARCVLPNATETKIVVTGNLRAWRHFISLRATEAADVEIRALAIEVLQLLDRAVPSVFGDFSVKCLDDGTEVASTSYREV